MRPLVSVPALALTSVLCGCTQTAPQPTLTTVVTETVTPVETSRATPPALSAGEHVPAPTTPVADSGRSARERASELIGDEIHSATGLEFALLGEGFSREDARQAVDSLDVDWNQQAVEAVLEMAEYSMYSRVEMLRELTQGGFTRSEADYGVAHADIDYREHALQQAYVIDQSADQMLFDDIRLTLIEIHGFLPEEAQWAVDNMYPDAVG